MTEKQFNWWVFGTSCAAGFSLGSAIMGIIDTIKDHRLERKIDRIRDTNHCNFAKIKEGHEELKKMFEQWNKENEELLKQAMKRTEA